MNTFSPPLAVFVKGVVQTPKKKPKTTMDPRGLVQRTGASRGLYAKWELVR